MKTKLRIKTRLKLWRNGNLILDTTRRKKSQIMLQLERHFHDRSRICVSYDKGFVNESDHIHDDQLKKALSTYTEKSLLIFVDVTKNERK